MPKTTALRIRPRDYITNRRWPGGSQRLDGSLEERQEVEERRMGMVDELLCFAQLPDQDVPAGAVFKTKAFAYPFLYRYRITKAGRLIDVCNRDLECDGLRGLPLLLRAVCGTLVGQVSSALLSRPTDKHRPR